MRNIAFVVISLLISAAAIAQQSGGSIAGRVVDPQGASAQGALVTARNPQTGFERSERTDAAGIYRLTALPPGSYEVTVDASGFAALVQKSVVVTVAQTQTLDVTLQIGTIAQDVSVVGNLPLTDVTSSSVGDAVDTERVRGLPLNGRQFANLAATLPGVGLAFHSDPTKGTNYAPLVNGGAGRNINYQIDGGDNNDDTVGGLLQQFPLEAVQEFRFETQRFKAEYGRSNGGVMNVVTKSGTNRYEGTLFELFRDKGMNSLTETEKLAGTAGQTLPRKGDYRRHQFGGSFGGPLVLDRVHFFFAVERTEQNTTQTVNTRGLFPDQDGVFPTPLRENLGSLKLSAALTSAQQLSVRYGRNSNRFPFNASPTTTPDNWADANNEFNSINTLHNWVAGGSKLNEVVFQYSDYRDHVAERTRADTLVFPNGVTTGSSLVAPQRTEQIKYQVRDDFSWLVSGRGGLGHTLKAGASFIFEPRLFIEAMAGKGVIVNVMRDNDASGPVRSVSMNDGEASANIPTKQYGFYAQDDWRLSPRLTLNLGVRYDLITGLNFDQSKNPNFVKIQTAAQAGSLDGIAGLENFALDARSDRNNVQPRIGGVFDLAGDGKSILRGGWGIYTDFGYTNSNVLQASLDASGNRYGAVFSATNPAGLKNPDGSFYRVGQPVSNLESQNQSAAGPPLLGFWVDPRLQQPYQLQTNVGWSHEVTSNTVLRVDYVNALGRDLNYKPRVNQLIAGTTTRRVSERLSQPLSPNSSSNRPALSRGRSRYNAFIFSGRRRFSNGFDLLASYTLSSALSTIGNASDELNTANIQNPDDPFDNPVQLGPNVTTDARHRVNVSAVVRLPYGVQLAPLFIYRSALPVFIVDPRDANKDGDPFDIPAEAYAVVETDAATGKSVVESTGPCRTVNCGRGWPQSQFNVRISKVFPAGRARFEVIGEVFNLFNAINPSNIVGGISANRNVVKTTGEPDPTLLQPASFSGDSQRPEQRVGQIGIRLSF
jgi:carboxypeptidase family protein/TonB-dependent receptor-like protein